MRAPGSSRRCRFPVRRLERHASRAGSRAAAILQEEAFDYVILFESSGMYNGEDVPRSPRT